MKEIKYSKLIIETCANHDISFFEQKLKDCDSYFEEAKKNGWPSVKTGEDLIVECQKFPFIQDCIAYHKGEFKI